MYYHAERAAEVRALLRALARVRVTALPCVYQQEVGKRSDGKQKSPGARGGARFSVSSLLLSFRYCCYCYPRATRTSSS